MDAVRRVARHLIEVDRIVPNRQAQLINEFMEDHPERNFRLSSFAPSTWNGYVKLNSKSKAISFNYVSVAWAWMSAEHNDLLISKYFYEEPSYGDELIPVKNSLISLAEGFAGDIDRGKSLFGDIFGRYVFFYRYRKSRGDEVCASTLLIMDNGGRVDFFAEIIYDEEDGDENIPFKKISFIGSCIPHSLGYFLVGGTGKFLFSVYIDMIFGTRNIPDRTLIVPSFKYSGDKAIPIKCIMIKADGYMEAGVFEDEWDVLRHVY